MPTVSPTKRSISISPSRILEAENPLTLKTQIPSRNAFSDLRLGILAQVLVDSGVDLRRRPRFGQANRDAHGKFSLTTHHPCAPHV